MNPASSAAAPAHPAANDDFGAGVFEEPAKKPAPAVAKAAAAAPAPVAAPAAKTVQPADDDDGFGSGLL